MEDTRKKEGLEEETHNRPTKGEQCMLFMIITTLLIFLIFLIVFAIHLALIKHTVSDIFQASTYDNDEDKPYETNVSEWGTSDQSSENRYKENSEHVGWLAINVHTLESETLFGIENAVIGIVYLNISSPRLLCNALKINNLWSLVPGYCSALWSDRHLTEYKSAWLTRYYIGRDIIDLEVLRNVPHPHFNRSDFSNNIGLLEHYRPAKCKVPLTTEVKKMAYEDCFSAIFAVAAPRNYEICYEFTVKTDSCVDNGGFLQEDHRTIGLFSWMNRCPDMDLPLVVLTLHSFHRWIADTTAISSTDLESNSG